MPFARSPAVCLYRIDYSETSQVVRFFTPAHGRISCIAKGAKRRKGPFLAPFEPLSVYDLIRIEKRPGTLDVVTQAERVRSFPALRADFGRFSAACYGLEFVQEFSPEGQPVPDLFERLVELLERLEAGAPVPDALFSFEARALGLLGYGPRARECGACRRPVRPPDAWFSPADGGALCAACPPRGERGFAVRWAALESVGRFAAGEMPREPMRRALVVEIRRILDAWVRHYLERDLKSARFVRDTVAAGCP